MRRYGQLKYARTPKFWKFWKFWTPVKPKILVWEQKKLVWVILSSRGTSPPKMNKIEEKRILYILCWNSPEGYKNSQNPN